MNNKRFLTHNQQMKKLNKEKLIKCEGSEHKTLLERNGYFNLANAYKIPFTVAGAQLPRG